MSTKIIKFNKLIIAVIMMSLMGVVGCNNDPADELPTEKKEMFPFLKVGNIFTYQYDYVEFCGTGYVSDIVTFGIDSTIINDTAIMYYGTKTFYSRGINWVDGADDYSIDTFDVYTNNNVPLFIVKDSVVSFLFAGSLKIPHNCEIGTIIDTIFNFDNEKIYCKFDKIEDYTVGKQIGYFAYEGILYTNCFTSFYGKKNEVDQRHHDCVYSKNYGLIYISKGYFHPLVGPSGNTLSLIEVNF